VLAKRLGRRRSDIANTVRLLELPDEAIELIDAGVLSKGYGKALLTEPDHDRRRLLARRSAQDGWSVRTLETEIARLPRPPKPRHRSQSYQPGASAELEEAIAKATAGTFMRHRTDTEFASSSTKSPPRAWPRFSSARPRHDHSTSSSHAGRSAGSTWNTTCPHPLAEKRARWNEDWTVLWTALRTESPDQDPSPPPPAFNFWVERERDYPPSTCGRSASPARALCCGGPAGAERIRRDRLGKVGDLRSRLAEDRPGDLGQPQLQRRLGE
jgi:hypothetical protein